MPAAGSKPFSVQGEGEHKSCEDRGIPGQGVNIRVEKILM